jgi:isoquinoline 1-oxidoreductase alpha subunit
MVDFMLNGEVVTAASEGDTPLLWVLREELKLRGTKFGCGIAQCGACTVHIDGNPMRSCITPVSAVSGKSVTTIEGLATPVGEALKTAWTRFKCLSVVTASQVKSCRLQVSWNPIQILLTRKLLTR